MAKASRPPVLIDFHSHVLPGLDHGCADLATSKKQLAAAAAAGVAVLAATSHFYPNEENLEDFLARRALAWERLQEALPETAPRLLLGAEVQVCPGMEHMEGLDRLAFGDGAILMELPSGYWSRSLIETVAALHELFNGKAVLAHVERYDPKNMDALLYAGIPGQVNGYALCGLLDRPRLTRWIREGKIAALGSDTHGLDGRFMKLAKAVKRLGSGYGRIEESSKRLLGLRADAGDL